MNGHREEAKALKQHSCARARRWIVELARSWLDLKNVNLALVQALGRRDHRVSGGALSNMIIYGYVFGFPIKPRYPSRVRKVENGRDDANHRGIGGL
jgi:hypothetical protein